MGKRRLVEGNLYTYEILKRLGQGAFGEVSSARVLETGQIVAIKRIPIRALEGLPNNVIREYKSLQLIEHRNVVTLHDVFPKGQALYLVQEFCVTDLSHVIKRQRRSIPDAIIKGLFRQILFGLQALHSKGIVHRDIKPSNVLLSLTGVAKIGDLGLARPLDEQTRPNYTHTVATRWYRAPELLYGSRTYGSSVDTWSAGLVLAELFALSPLVAGDSDINQLNLTLQTFGDMEPKWPGVKSLPDYGKVSFPSSSGIPLDQLLPSAPPDAIALLSKLLAYDPDSRPSLDEALNAPYFVLDPAPANERTIAMWMARTLAAAEAV
eukprot:CAMPEP_0175063990 /NCGR_PEP_ID=MMETSP0052_2-20121109/15072_1 /TAXON_ID=51329 ORGANISM="Polytomella parva, Strain SAG 63-3" /NCGR_SAMPLE_ID=MMETSP0052_2 /ASSEMBLY_ACC=CAM_ASM_000194 /LENGTH=321 /DNA_ID=CAMNT_0016330267 /DNA_START=162 /DNA_END=1124 /DNA_ORIENTATION=+